MGRFDGKVVLVTGASRGIGRETALEFARQGADVAVHYASSMELAREVAEEISKMGRGAAIFQAQFADSLSKDTAGRQIRDMMNSIKNAFGGLDIVVANAANSTGRESLDKALRTNRSNFNTSINLTNGLYGLLGQSLSMLTESGGTFVSVSSVATKKQEPEALMYILAKRGVEAFSEEVADELLRRGVNIKCLRFGPVETDALEYFRDNFPVIASVIKRWPQFIATPSEAARQVVEYCDPDKRWWTHGTVVDLTRGLSSFNLTADLIDVIDRIKNNPAN